MRIAIVCNDSRGGVQPYVGLALGLRKVGVQVHAVAPGSLAVMFEAVGVPVTRLSGDVQSVMRASGGAAEQGTLASVRFAARQLRTGIVDAWMRETHVGCEGADLILGGIGGMGTGLPVAEALGVPFVEAHLQPLGVPTEAYPPVLAPWVPARPAALRRMSHRLSEALFWASFEGPGRGARQRVLGIRRAPRAHLDQCVLYGISPEVVQVPSVAGRRRYTTGFWTLPLAAGWTPPADIATFIASDGPPVVAIGFGSMTSGDPQALSRLVHGAAIDADVRVVLVGGWGGLALENDDTVRTIDAVPFEWLYHHVAAAVHHGGAGTTGASFRAGIPAVVVPFAMDQPFWGARVAALGAGPAPIARKRLTRDRLAEAIRSALAPTVRRRAAELGARIRAEDGVGEAVRRLTA